MACLFVNEAWAEQHPLVATTAETLTRFVINKTIEAAGDYHGVNLVNGARDRLISDGTEHPVATALFLIAAAPVLEEVIFREVPFHVGQRLRKQNPTATRTVNVAAALAFALFHAGNPLKAQDRKDLAVPITPLIGATHYAHLRKHRGLKYVLWSHALYNTLHVAAAIPKIRVARSGKFE